MYELDLADPRATAYSQEVTASGGVWGASLDDWVYVLVGNGWSIEADLRIREIKGGERGPISGWLPLDYVPRLLDGQRVLPSAASKLMDGPYLSERFGGRALLRYPVGSAPFFPLWMVSHDGAGFIFQQFSYEVGNEAAFALQKACHETLGAAFPDRLPLLMATSMNYSGEEQTITDPKRAHVFCLRNGIELLIHCGSGKKRGSYPRLSSGKNRNVLQRWGNLRESEISHLQESLPETFLEGPESLEK